MGPHLIPDRSLLSYVTALVPLVVNQQARLPALPHYPSDEPIIADTRNVIQESSHPEAVQTFSLQS